MTNGNQNGHGGFSTYVPWWIRNKPPSGTGPGSQPGGGNPNPSGGFCSFFYWTAIVTGLTFIVLIAFIILFPVAIVGILIAMAAALVLFLVALGFMAAFCNINSCNIHTLFTWLFMWSAIIVLVVGAVAGNGLVLLLGTCYGAIAGLLVRLQWQNACLPVPTPLRRP